MSKKYVYLFKEGNADMRELLGGKGANLAEMTNLGLPIPQGFTVTTEACTDYYNSGKKITYKELKDKVPFSHPAIFNSLVSMISSALTMPFDVFFLNLGVFSDLMMIEPAP